LKADNQALASAYKEFCAELSATLYDEDPAGMGSTSGAPRNEYDGVAQKIAASLRDIRSREEITPCLEKFFDAWTPSLVDRIERALAKFRLKVRTAIKT
jgi:hypothetical protein